MTLTPRSFASEVGEIAALELAPDGYSFAIAGSNGSVQLRQTSDGGLIQSFAGLSGTANQIAFAPDGQTIAASATDGMVQIWRMTDSEPIATLSGASGALAFAPDGQTLAVGEDDFRIRLSNVSDGSVVQTFEGNVLLAQDLAFSSDGQTLAASDSDEYHSVLIWQVSDGILLQTIDRRTSDHNPAAGSSGAVALSPDGQILAAGDQWGFANLWGVSDGSLIATFTEHTDIVTSLDFSPDGQTLASAAPEYGAPTVHLWRVSDGEPLGALDLGAEVYSAVQARYAPDGSLRVIAGLYTETVLLWEFTQ